MSKPATYNDISAATAGGAKTLSLGNTIKRVEALPLDKYSIFPSYAEASAYAAGTVSRYEGLAYEGQVVAVSSEAGQQLYVVDSSVSQTYLKKVGGDGSSGEEGITETQKATLGSFLSSMADMIQYLTFNSASHNGNIVYANAVAAAQAFGGGTPVTMYTITRNTSNYTISNTAQNVIENARYYAVLAPTSGYQINAVTITMGGVSITSTAWNNATKTIDIEHVTGNIVINVMTSVVSVSTISADFQPGGTVITTDNTLNDLKQYLTVTANYNDGTSQIVTGYTLTGSLSSAGTQTITVTYSGKTTTFTVNVVSASKTLTGITAVYNQNGKSITTASSVNDVATLPATLTVTAHYDDSSSETLVSGAYALSGTLTVGTSTITVSYGGKTATFQVTVTAVDLTSINVAFAQSRTVYDNETLENLKPLLTVTATYSDGTTKSVSGYTLSGTLSEGVSTITISYTENGITKTDTFTVTVTHYEAPLTGLYATYDGATMYDYDAPNDIRSHLTVTLDGNAVEPSAYYITGPMVGGTTNTLSISYNGETTTISVDVVDQIISQQKLPMRTLPAGYTQLDYIYPDVSDETACFIQLSGLRSRQVSYAKYGIQPLNHYQGYVTGNETKRTMLGTKIVRYPSLTVGKSGDGQFAFSQTKNNLSGVPYSWQDITQNPSIAYIIEGFPDMYINGQYMGSQPQDDMIAQDSNDFIVFGHYTNGIRPGYKSICLSRLLFLRMYDNNNQLIRDFVPCKDSSDNAGLYDLVNNVFWKSYPTGNALLPGNPIS